MTSITNIDIKDIREFILENGFKSKNDADDYNTAKNLIVKRKAKVYTNPIIDWIIAYNVVKLKLDVRSYTRSEINSFSDNELIQFAKLLRLERNDNIRTSIINILYYLDKIKEEININQFPQYIILEIFKNDKPEKLKSLCNSSKYFQQLCESSEVKNFILNDIFLYKNTLDISDYNFNELINYSKIVHLKKRIGALQPSKKYGDNFKKNYIYLVDINGNVIIDNNFFNLKGSINQILLYDRHGRRNIAILTKNGKLYSYMYDEYKLKPIMLTLNTQTRIKIDKVCAIFPTDSNIDELSNSFTIFTTTGDYYIYNGNLRKIDFIQGLIQIKDSYLLTEKGEVYYLSYYEDGEDLTDYKIDKIIKKENYSLNRIEGLRDIIQLTNDYVLSKEGKIFQIGEYFIVFLYPYIDDITEIVSLGHNPIELIAVNSNYEMFKIININDRPEIMNNKNIIQICGSSNNPNVLIYLDDKDDKDYL